MQPVAQLIAEAAHEEQAEAQLAAEQTIAWRGQLNEGMPLDACVRRGAECDLEVEVAAVPAAADREIAPISKPDRVEDEAPGGGKQQPGIAADRPLQLSAPQRNTAGLGDVGKLGQRRLQDATKLAGADFDGLRTGLDAGQECQGLQHLLEGLQGRFDAATDALQPVGLGHVVERTCEQLSGLHRLAQIVRGLHPEARRGVMPARPPPLRHHRHLGPSGCWGPPAFAEADPTCSRAAAMACCASYASWVKMPAFRRGGSCPAGLRSRLAFKGFPCRHRCPMSKSTSSMSSPASRPMRWAGTS